MKEIIFGGLLVAVLFLVGISLTHEYSGVAGYYQNHCSQSDAVACIEHGQRIPNN